MKPLATAENSTPDQLPHRPWWRRNAVRFGVVGVALAILAFWLWPTVFLATEGKFGTHWIRSYRSPHGRLKLEVSKRYAFPATDLFDPASIVSARLTDDAGRELDRVSVRLLDDSDWQDPGLRWMSNRVEVVGFDRRFNQSLLLSLIHRQ